MPLVQGDLLHRRYRIIDILGHGGMGSVYRAHDESLNIDVAVKENLFTTDDYASQFRLEATILAGLRHPNLPRVTDHFVLPEQGQYLVMDYIEGPDLRQILEQKGAISETEAIRIGAAICDALAYLHSRNPIILHRDIKLGNVKIVPDGHICLVDFGLAKVVEGDQPTMTGARAMTPGYSPPEQYGTSRTDARSDIYSLGATLYASLTGFIPEDSLARAIDGLELTPILKRNPKVSERLAAVIEKAMETAASNRYQTAQEFKAAILGQEPKSEPVNTPAIQESNSEPIPTPDLEMPPLPSAIDAPVSEPVFAEVPQKKSRLRPLFFSAIVLTLMLITLAYINPEMLPSRLVATSSRELQQPISPSASPIVSSSETGIIATSIVSPEPTVTSTLVSTATLRPTQTLAATTAPVLMPTPVGGGTGKIAFATTREGISQIYTMNIDGSDQARLFLAEDGACQPHWSSDGKRLVFITPCRTRQSLYENASIAIYDLETKEIRNLPSVKGGDFDPAWSPNGEYIVFTSLRDSLPQNMNTQIYKINVSTFEITRLIETDQSQPARYPIWSPDGTMIVYSLRRFGLWQLWKIDVNGNEAEQFLRSGTNLNDFQPSWSPDGLSIYFNQTTGSDDAAVTRLMRFILADKSVKRVALPPLQDVSLSPDGNWLVCEGTDGNNLDIYKYDVSTQIALPLTTDPQIDFDPDWQP